VDRRRAGYREIADWLTQQCRALPPGSPVPSEPQLAAQFGVNRQTARHALETVRAAGLIERRRGAGSFTAAPPLHRSESVLYAFSDEIRRRGGEPSSVVVEAGMAVLPDRAQLMGLDPRQALGRVYRIRLSDTVPLALETCYIPHKYRSVLDRDLTRDSLHQALKDLGAVPHRATGFLTARIATPAECDLLDQDPPAALLVESRLVSDPAGAVIESTETAYLGSRWAIDTAAAVAA
jgi:GntR family transcriptional regulator